MKPVQQSHLKIKRIRKNVAGKNAAANWLVTLLVQRRALMRRRLGILFVDDEMTRTNAVLSFATPYRARAEIAAELRIQDI